MRDRLQNMMPEMSGKEQSMRLAKEECPDRRCGGKNKG